MRTGVVVNIVLPLVVFLALLVAFPPGCKTITNPDGTTSLAIDLEIVQNELEITLEQIDTIRAAHAGNPELLEDLDVAEEALDIFVGVIKVSVASGDTGEISDAAGELLGVLRTRIIHKWLADTDDPLQIVAALALERSLISVQKYYL